MAQLPGKVRTSAGTQRISEGESVQLKLYVWLAGFGDTEDEHPRNCLINARRVA